MIQDARQAREEALAALAATPTGLLVDGRFREASAGGSIAIVDPSTGAVLGEVAEALEEDVDDAVAAARRALTSDWGTAVPSQRETWLRRLAELVQANRRELALLETLDTGMPVRLAGSLVARAVQNLHYYAGWPTKITGETIRPSTPGSDAYHVRTYREPVGVVGAIIPWNASLTAATGKLGPALACGNSVVVKTAEQTPLTVLRLGQLAMEAGIPDGVVNVVQGRGETAGSRLTSHADVDMIAFTGSTETGRRVVEASAGNMKRVLVELGGKSPDIIFADADLDAAISAAARAIFGNSGQVCTAGSRVLVERSVHDRVVNGLAHKARALRVGSGFDPSTHLGPLVSAAQLERVTGYVELGVSEGATLVAGGEPPTGSDLEGGYYVAPAVFADADHDMRIVREEIFGPVVTVTPFDTVGEAIEMANDTQYGLAAGVWTNHVDTAERVVRGVHAGTVWHNCNQFNDPSVPFGGYRMSGYGREYGSESVHEYTQVKSVWSVMRTGER